jgi:hypothetical protein
MEILGSSHKVDDPVERRRQECRRLCTVLLGRLPSPDLEAGFLRAYDLLPELASTEQSLHRLLASPIDLEAVEIAWRSRSPRNPLTQRFQVLSYLAEVRSANGSFHGSAGTGPFRGLIILGGHLLRTFVKRLRGRMLLRRAGDL